MLKSTIGWSSCSRLVSLRFFSTGFCLRNEAAKAVANEGSSKADKHLDFLTKFYTPELLQSIKITESLIDPETYLELRKKGHNAKSRVPPSNLDSDYAMQDPEYQEPIVYPNQTKGHAPFPPIPQIASPDRHDLVLRFKPNVGKHKPPMMNTGEIAQGLAKLTGLDATYIRRLYVRPLLMKRTSNQTAKGKIPSFYALTVVGDKNGMIGLGEGSSRDGVRSALVKAHWNAVTNLTPINRYEDRTILGDFEHKFHAVHLHMKSAPPGFGLRVNKYLFEMCVAAGIKDLRGKIYRSRNPMNVCKGFLEALTKQKSLEELAVGRGKKLVDLKKVYYSA